VDLPKALERLPKCLFRDNMIRMAKRGDFHDFASRLDLPKTSLVEMLEEGAKKTGDNRYSKLAQDAREGRFDDDPGWRKR
jgi:hypothetical protein